MILVFATIAGVVVGLVHFALLRRSVAVLLGGRSMEAVVLGGLRMGLTGVVAWAAVTQGVGAAMALLGGLLVARVLALGRWGRPT